MTQPLSKSSTNSHKHTQERSQDNAPISPPALANFADTLLEWFDTHGRKDLPWQENKTAYRVWVSEIMLQQTQVATVIDYYQRFMSSFPNVESLATADEDEVLEHWSGLGYYARARNLHKTAKQVVTEHKGVFPTSVDDLQTLPGIGRSTAGAITSIANGTQAAILDGNVKRVLTRLVGIEIWPGERATESRLWQISEQLTPAHRVGDYTQAIMDLGATLCTRSKPQCERCPFTTSCVAHQEQKQDQIPASKPKKQKPEKAAWFAIIEHPEQGILLEKRAATGIWGGLYSLPEIERNTQHAKTQNDGDDHFDNIRAELESRFKLALDLDGTETPFAHVFSHYKLHIHPIRFKVNSKLVQIRDGDDIIWRSEKQLSKVGLPAPVKKLLCHPSSQQALDL